MKPFALAVMLAASSIVVADQRADIQARYNSLAAAVKKKDLKASMAFLTSDYTDIDLKGKKHTRKEFEAMIKEHFAMDSKMTSFEIKISKVTPRAADVIVENASKLALEITDPTTKKVHKITTNATARDVWVQQKGVWLLKSSTMLTEKRTVDGKVIGGR